MNRFLAVITNVLDQSSFFLPVLAVNNVVKEVSLAIFRETISLLIPTVSTSIIDDTVFTNCEITYHTHYLVTSKNLNVVYIHKVLIVAHLHMIHDTVYVQILKGCKSHKLPLSLHKYKNITSDKNLT